MLRVSGQHLPTGGAGALPQPMRPVAAAGSASRRDGRSAERHRSALAQGEPAVCSSPVTHFEPANSPGTSGPSCHSLRAMLHPTCGSMRHQEEAVLQPKPQSCPAGQSSGAGRGKKSGGSTKPRGTRKTAESLGVPKQWIHGTAGGSIAPEPT